MFGSIQKENENKEKVKAALTAYSQLVNVSNEFWDRCCRVIDGNDFNGAIKCIDKKKGILSIMGFCVTAEFAPVSDNSGNIFGKITFKHETTELCKILFDVSGRVLSQTCSEFSFYNMLKCDGLEAIFYDFVGKFIESDVMKDKENAN
jgi:hypothetical protein